MTNFSYGMNMELISKKDALMLVACLLDAKLIKQNHADLVRRNLETSVSITKDDLVNALSSEIATKDFVRAELEKLRTEMAETKSELKQDIAVVKLELKQDIAEVKLDIAKLDKKFTTLAVITVLVVIVTSPRASEILNALLSFFK